MRTSRRIGILVAVGLALGLGSAVAFDATRGPVTPVGPVGPVQVAPAVSIDLFPRGAAILAPGALQAAPTLRNLTPLEAFRSGAQALRAGDTKNGLSSLEYAAASGHPIAQWKLGRMYAEGDGVRRDELKAFEYFRQVANQRADAPPGTPQAPFVARAFVELGGFFLRGIPNSTVLRDPERAREMFQYATYYGDGDAQYQLAKLYIDAPSPIERNPGLAAKWLYAAAQKDHYRAQAMLGDMLFRGKDVPRQAARGLMWLTLAREAAASEADGWIVKLYESAMQTASIDDKVMADAYLRQWMKNSVR